MCRQNEEIRTTKTFYSCKDPPNKRITSTRLCFMLMHGLTSPVLSIKKFNFDGDGVLKVDTSFPHSLSLPEAQGVRSVYFRGVCVFGSGQQFRGVVLLVTR